MQQDGRLPLSELGRRVSLSASATTKRVRRLEADGVVTGYGAKVDLGKVGLPLLAVVRLRTSGARHDAVIGLVRERQQILECLRTTGDDCYLIKVAVASMSELQVLVDELAQYGDTNTSLVYSQTVPYRGPRPG